MSYCYLKEDRLRNPKDYKQVKEMGCKLHTPHFVLFIKKNDYSKPRLGITVSRRVGNAVVRNRVKRFLKEFFRSNKSSFSECDYSIIARHNSGQMSYADVNEELSFLFDNMVDI